MDFSQDWQAALSALASRFPQEEEITQEQHSDVTVTADSLQSGALHIVLERKGRGGNTATIICGFTIDEESLKTLAAEIKRSLGCGGSARGGEILIQGDRVLACRKFLTEKGYKVK